VAAPANETWVVLFAVRQRYTRPAAYDNKAPYMWCI